MAVREKWPRIAEHMGDVPPLQLRREIARAAMLFLPDMLSDPGFNEGVLEFSLYFDLLQRLRSVSETRLRAAAGGDRPADRGGRRGGVAKRNGRRCSGRSARRRRRRRDCPPTRRRSWARRWRSTRGRSRRNTASGS